MTQSEESVTLMTAYRLPHQASGSFIFVQDDILPFFCYGSRFFANMHNDAFCHLLKKEGSLKIKYFQKTIDKEKPIR